MESVYLGTYIPYDLDVLQSENRQTKILCFHKCRTKPSVTILNLVIQRRTFNLLRSKTGQEPPSFYPQGKTWTEREGISPVLRPLGTLSSPEGREVGAAIQVRDYLLLVKQGEQVVKTKVLICSPWLCLTVLHYR